MSCSAGHRRHVRFVPPQPHHLLSSYYRAADVCLVPSRSESIQLVTLEAATCGTPSLLSRRLAHARRSRALGLPGRGAGSRVFAAYTGELLTNGVLAAEMSAAAAARAGGYTWSMSAARLRRLYADLTVGALVECS